MKPIALYTIGAINIRVFAHYDDVDVRKDVILMNSCNYQVYSQEKTGKIDVREDQPEHFQIIVFAESTGAWCDVW